VVVKSRFWTLASRPIPTAKLYGHNGLRGIKRQRRRSEAAKCTEPVASWTGHLCSKNMALVHVYRTACAAVLRRLDASASERPKAEGKPRGVSPVMLACRTQAAR